MTNKKLSKLCGGTKILKQESHGAYDYNESKTTTLVAFKSNTL